MAKGWGVPAIAKPTIEPLGCFQIGIIVVMPGHLLERMPLGDRERKERWMAHYIGQCPEANLIQTVFGVGWVFREYSRVWPGAQGRHHRGATSLCRHPRPAEG